MSRIDPARLSRILASLAKPGVRVDASNKHGATHSSGKIRNSRKDPAVLRANLKERLARLRRSSEDFDSAAPVILVQEILLWEFGRDIVEHVSFEQAVNSIADAMLADRNAEAAISRLLIELTEE